PLAAPRCTFAAQTTRASGRNRDRAARHHACFEVVAMKWIAIVLACASCMEGEDEGGGGAVADSRCASGLRWAGGNTESALMHPAADCIGCHASGEGPQFVIAGTVMAALDEPTDCYGVQGAVVTITDATSATIALMTNEAGNFFVATAVAMPITASVEYQG